MPTASDTFRGMSRIDEMFARCRAANRGALMPFVVAGHPTLDSLPGILRSLQASGADAVEIGVPFSDPIADGPVIAAAMHDALVAGATVEGVLDVVASIRDEITMPLVAMVSVSIVDRLGGAAFLGRLADAGFDGAIVPDADLDALDRLVEAADRRGLAFTTLIAPDTSSARASRIADSARGFVYVLARKGLTGERSDAPDLESRAAELRKVTDLPLAAGFGISTPEHVRAVLKDADGAIVGSALVRAMTAASGGGSATPEEAAGAFVRPLAEAAGGAESAT